MIKTCSNKKPDLGPPKINSKSIKLHKSVQVSNQNKFFKSSKACQTSFNRLSNDSIELNNFNLDQLFETNECISSDTIELNIRETSLKQIFNFNEQVEFKVIHRCQESIYEIQTFNEFENNFYFENEINDLNNKIYLVKSKIMKSKKAIQTNQLKQTISFILAIYLIAFKCYEKKNKVASSSEKFISEIKPNEDKIVCKIFEKQNKWDKTTKKLAKFKLIVFLLISLICMSCMSLINYLVL